MLLNKKKSGIVVFAGRKAHTIPMMINTKETPSKNIIPLSSTKQKGTKKTLKRKWLSAQNDIDGIPICEKYKYLGTILTPKLTCDEQISHIKRKSAYLLVKLYPYLMNASAYARKDMWQSMVKPLFDAALVLLKYEPSKTQKENLNRAWRQTFKQFMMISKRTSTKLVQEMIGSNLESIAENVVTQCKAQWIQRKNAEDVTPKKTARKRPKSSTGSA